MVGAQNSIPTDHSASHIASCFHLEQWRVLWKSIIRLSAGTSLVFRTSEKKTIVLPFARCHETKLQTYSVVAFGWGS